MTVYTWSSWEWQTACGPTKNGWNSWLVYSEISKLTRHSICFHFTYYAMPWFPHRSIGNELLYLSRTSGMWYCLRTISFGKVLGEDNTCTFMHTPIIYCALAILSVFHHYCLQAITSLGWAYLQYIHSFKAYIRPWSPISTSLSSPLLSPFHFSQEQLVNLKESWSVMIMYAHCEVVYKCQKLQSFHYSSHGQVEFSVRHFSWSTRVKSSLATFLQEEYSHR